METVNDKEALQQVIHGLSGVSQTDPKEIVIEGEILLQEPLFGHDIHVPLVFKGKNAVLDGGFRVRGFYDVTVNGINAWCAPISGEQAGNLQLDQLYVNGERRYRPVFPENDSRGFSGVVTEKDGILREMVKEDWITSNNRFRYHGELPEFADPKSLELHILHCWVHERLNVVSVDSAQSLINTETGTRFCVLDTERCQLVNVFECLKKPGQYYYDKSKSLLYYIPKEGETPDNAEVIVPLAGALLRFESCSDITMEGISFRYVAGRSDYFKEVTSKDYQDRFITTTHSQSECEMGGSVEFHDCCDCRIWNCCFENIGVYGVSVSGNSHHISVENCTFQEMGCGALKTEHDNLHYIHISDIRFVHNTVKGYGRVYHSACAVLMTKVTGCSVEQNEICDGEYSGISCGWTWGYENTGYCGNRICDNHLYNIGKDRLDDMGAIYTLGIQPFTVISGNHIHDITTEGPACFGIYLDEGSSCMTVEDNLVYRVNGEGIHIHYGRDNIVRHNIVAVCERSLLHCTRSEDHIQFYVTENVFYNKNQRMFRVKKDNFGVISNGNFYYADGKDVLFSRTLYEPEERFTTMDEWILVTGNDTMSKVEDPLFVDKEGGDFRLSAESPVLKLWGKAFSKWVH